MAGSYSFGSPYCHDYGSGGMGDAVDELGLLASQVSGNRITVHLAYAQTAQLQHYRSIQVDKGTTLYEALAQAGWLLEFPELALWCQEMANIQVPTAKRWHVGIYSQKQPLSYQLQDLDRIEVYRSLSADPMSQRKSKS